MRFVWCFLVLGFSAYLSACEDGTDTDLTPSPTPPEAFGESIEDTAWEGWYQYTDEQLQINTYLTFVVLEYRDGLWCGALIQDYTSPGSYLGYATLTGWNEVVDNNGLNAAEYGAIVGRVYGEMLDSGDMKGWIDSINDFNLADPAATPSIEESSRDFVTKSVNALQLQLNPDVLTTAELIELMGDAAEMSSGNTSGDPSATEPTFTSIDLPAALLGDRHAYTSSLLESSYCLWAVETNDTRTTSQPGFGR